MVHIDWQICFLIDSIFKEVVRSKKAVRMSYLLLGVVGFFTALSGSILIPLLKNGWGSIGKPAPKPQAIEKRSCDILQCRQHHYPSCTTHVRCDEHGELVSNKDFLQNDPMIYCPPNYVFEGSDVLSLAERLLDAHEPQHRASCWNSEVLLQGFMFWPKSYQAAFHHILGGEWITYTSDLALRRPDESEHDRSLALAIVLAYSMDTAEGLRVVPLIPLLDHEPDIRQVNTRPMRPSEGAGLAAAKPGTDGWPLKGFLGPHGGLQLLARHGKVDSNKTFGPPLKISVSSIQKDLRLSTGDVTSVLQKLAKAGCSKGRLITPLLQYEEIDGFAAKTVDCRVRLLTEMVTLAIHNAEKSSDSVLLSAPIYRRVYWDLGMACMTVRQQYQTALAQADDLIDAENGTVGAWINRFATEELLLLNRCEAAFREKLANLGNLLSPESPPTLSHLVPEIDSIDEENVSNEDEELEEDEFDDFLMSVRLKHNQNQTNLIVFV